MIDKELAIKVAERVGDKAAKVFLNRDETWGSNSFDIYVRVYLKNKASEIFLSEGMAGKISEYLRDNKRVKNESTTHVIADWFSSSSDNGTLKPQKILTLWLEME